MALVEDAATEDRKLVRSLASRYLAFVRSAWNPKVGRFRNFMSYSRFWREDVRWYGVGKSLDTSFESRSLAFYLDGASQGDRDIYAMVNAWWEPLSFEIQEGEAGQWRRVADTSLGAPDDFLDPGDEAVVEGRVSGQAALGGGSGQVIGLGGSARSPEAPRGSRRVPERRAEVLARTVASARRSAAARDRALVEPSSRPRYRSSGAPAERGEARLRRRGRAHCVDTPSRKAPPGSVAARPSRETARDAARGRRGFPSRAALLAAPDGGEAVHGEVQDGSASRLDRRPDAVPVRAVAAGEERVAQLAREAAGDLGEDGGVVG
jgi:hypothetical protein